VQPHQQQQGEGQVAVHGAEVLMKAKIRPVQKIQRFSQLASVMLKLAGMWEVPGNMNTAGIMIQLQLRIQEAASSMMQYLLKSQCMRERQLAAAAATPQQG
jgi:acetamidase/formamidase